MFISAMECVTTNKEQQKLLPGLSYLFICQKDLTNGAAVWELNEIVCFITAIMVCKMLYKSTMILDIHVSDNQIIDLCSVPTLI